MNKLYKDIISTLQKSNVIPILMDYSDTNCLLLVNNLNKAKSILKKMNVKKLKDNPHELYLYGVDKFGYYSKNGLNLTLCGSLACRSTLNGGWVPLDRKINLSAFDNLRIDPEGYNHLAYDNELCYLLAKCVYTTRYFSEEDCNRIQVCLNYLKDEDVYQKIEGVFFNFSHEILVLCRNACYENIVESVWLFSDY